MELVQLRPQTKCLRNCFPLFSCTPEVLNMSGMFLFSAGTVLLAAFTIGLRDTSPAKVAQRVYLAKEFFSFANQVLQILFHKASLSVSTSTCRYGPKKRESQTFEFLRLTPWKRRIDEQEIKNAT